MLDEIHEAIKEFRKITLGREKTCPFPKSENHAVVDGYCEWCKYLFPSEKVLQGLCPCTDLGYFYIKRQMRRVFP